MSQKENEPLNTKKPFCARIHRTLSLGAVTQSTFLLSDIMSIVLCRAPPPRVGPWPLACSTIDGLQKVVGQRLRQIQVLLDLPDLYIGQPHLLPPCPTQTEDKGQIIAHVLQLLKIASNANSTVMAMWSWLY